MHLKNSRYQKGDTIIEVLLVIGIVSLVLAGAFVATNRSLQASRSAQERTEALKVAESQAEHIKYLKENNTIVPWVEPTGTFCIKADGTSVQDSITDISTEPNCLFGERYQVSIERDGNNAYQVRVLWLSILNNATTTVGGTTYPGFEQLQIFYRI